MTKVSAEVRKEEIASLRDECKENNSDHAFDSGEDSPRGYKWRTHRVKPYEEQEISSRERQRLQERNSRRAIGIRKELRGYGGGLCHLNGHDSEEGDSADRRRNDSLDSSPEDESFMCLDDEMYDEYLSRQSNKDLVAHYMDMEGKVEELEKSLGETRLRNRTQTFDLDAELEKIRVFREEISKLLDENHQLEEENDRLEELLPPATHH